MKIILPRKNITKIYYKTDTPWQIKVLNLLAHWCCFSQSFLLMFDLSACNSINISNTQLGTLP